MFTRLFFPEGHGRRYAAMEGLRGFSVWLVFCTHLCITFAGMFYLTNVAITPLGALHGGRLKLLSWGASSNYGVDLFFLLSGFLLFRMMIARQGRFHYGRYLWQRILRIYPALLISLVFVAGVYIRRGDHVLELGTFLKNALLLNGIFELQVRAYNPVTWSLTYEFLFYLVCPLVLLVARWGVLHSTSRYLLFAYAVALGLLCLPNAYARALMFLAGGLLAVHSDEELTALAGKIPEWGVIGLYFAATTIFALRPDFYWDRSTIIFAPAALALTLKACFGSGWLNRMCRLRALRFFGNISYSFYLLHAVCLMMVGWRMTRWAGLPASPEIRFVIMAASGMTLALLLSSVLYLIAERGYFVRSKPGAPAWRRYQACLVLPGACALAIAFCAPEIAARWQKQPGASLVALSAQNHFRGVEVGGSARSAQHDDALVIEAFDIDPQIVLPPLAREVRQASTLAIDLAVPANTCLQVFYQTAPNEVYSEDHSRRLPLHRGANAVQIVLPPLAAGTRLRIDPSESPGAVAIRSITLR